MPQFSGTFDTPGISYAFPHTEGDSFMEIMLESLEFNDEFLASHRKEQFSNWACRKNINKMDPGKNT